MDNYSLFERFISSKIKRSSFFHSKLKYCYQYLNYLMHKKESEYSINKLCTIKEYNLESPNFFGYYDHSPWNNDMNYFLSHYENEGCIYIQVFDCCKNIIIKKIKVGTKFNYQQGVRPIWIDKTRFIFNEFKSNNLCSVIYDIKKNSRTTLDYPIQEVCLDRSILLSLNYGDYEKINKDYGYGLKDENSNNTSGIIAYSYDNKKIFEIEKIRIHNKSSNLSHIDKCEINHISHCRGSNRILFIYRDSSSCSNLFLYNLDTDNLKCVFSGTIVSHYCWINQNQVIAFIGKTIDSQNYFLIDLKKENYEIIHNDMGKNGDGHPSISPNKEWLVYDSYPNKSRMIKINLFNLKENYIIELGSFYSSMRYYGYYRCDLHPRWSPDGKNISIDSTHEGFRKNYIIDVSKIVRIKR